VTGYVRALNAHDAAAARRYLAPEYQKELARETPAFDEWVANIVSARLRTMPPPVTDPGTTGQYRAYRDLVEFAATYDAVFRTPSDFASLGPQTRFFIVGRSRSRNTWLILSIGTGP
jgi:hypothetical protein